MPLIKPADRLGEAHSDTLKEIGASSRTNAILIPHLPRNLASLTEQICNAMIEANQTVDADRGSESRRQPEAAYGVSGNGG